MANVLLFRSPSQGSPDPYETCLRHHGYIPHSVQVLETVFTNLEDLQRTLRSGPISQGYNGVIVTSARAAEAWKNVVDGLCSSSSSSCLSDSLATWSSVPFYAVGEATAAALAVIAQDCDSPLSPKDIRGGSESGTGEQLAHFILRDLSDMSSRKLLHLAGDKTLDTLPHILLEAGSIELDRLQVYRTEPSPRLDAVLAHIIREGQSGNELGVWWIVHFAPSAARIVTPLLRAHFDLVPIDVRKEHFIRMAAIGPTTSKFVREEMKLRVDVVPKKPKPDELAASISEYDKKQRASDG